MVEVIESTCITYHGSLLSLDMKNKNTIPSILFSFILIATGVAGYSYYQNFQNEKKVLNQIIERLQADTRVADVIVSDVSKNPVSGRELTTIKFLEYDINGDPMEPKYFTFSNNLIQFQSLVIRFDDLYIRNGNDLRDKSVYLFWKAFMLDGKNTEEFVITELESIPEGYQIAELPDQVEEQYWSKFWTYALDQRSREERGIKNSQVEAPGTRFVPGVFYSIQIEHDGGLRIDSKEIPNIMRGEKIL